MPTYEYQCDVCEHNFEEFQSIAEEPLTKCPKCKKKKLRRVYGAGGAIIFKGSGFYQTDYRSESYKAAAKADQESSKGTADKTSTNGTAASSGKDSGAAPAKSGEKTSRSST